MNFNVGGFNESIKYSYQQFCKQDAEGRESNRRLLVKLKKFEAKSFDLVAQTQVAQQMRNQYERMLMQQNPVLWAQIQRNIATEITDFELERPLTSHSSRKYTREMAINTSLNSSTSEQHSLHEEGVWPHTPSPFPELDIQQFVSDKSTHLNICSSTLTVPHSKDTLDNLNKNGNSKVSNSQSASQNESLIPHLQGYSHDKHPPTSVPDTQQPAQNIAASPQVDNFIPANSSTPNSNPNVTAKQNNPCMNPPSTSTVSNLELLKEESNRVIEDNLEQGKNVKLTTTIELKTPVSSLTEILAANPIKTYIESKKGSNDEDFRKLQPTETVIGDEAQHVSPHQSPQNIKPFCLDSESDGADDPISGPLSGKNVGDDDSDSFWN